MSARELLSAERLAEYAALAEAATPGPWEVLPSGSSWLVGSERASVVVATVEEDSYRVPGDDSWDDEQAAEQACADAAFAAAARSAVPELLAEVKQLRAERDIERIWYRHAARMERRERERADRLVKQLREARARVAELEHHTTTEAVPCVRPEPHPAHLHSGLRNGAVVHGRCPGALAEEPLVVSRFDVPMEPAPGEEQVLTIGAVAEDGRPVALLLDPEDRAKVARWLGPDRAEVLREAARLLEDTDRDDDAVNLLDNMADAAEAGEPR